MAVMVCSHCTRCFSVAAQFSACRETFVAMPQLVSDLVRILRFRVSKCSFFYDHVEFVITSEYFHFVEFNKIMLRRSRMYYFILERRNSSATINRRRMHLVFIKFLI